MSGWEAMQQGAPDPFFPNERRDMNYLTNTDPGDENDAKPWRRSHAWLRGYSDAMAGKDADPSTHADYADAYQRGYDYVQSKRWDILRAA